MDALSLGSIDLPLISEPVIFKSLTNARTASAMLKGSASDNGVDEGSAVRTKVEPKDTYVSFVITL